MTGVAHSEARWAPGALVRARGREWIVLPGSDDEILRLRPLSGSEQDVSLLHLGVEPDVAAAHFPPPAADSIAGQEAARLLRDALVLSLRRGAGPFRSFGNIAFEPRAYQLVPLLMALKLDVVRLLIADDVGIGKTIEAGLIARELYDRGEIARIAVLCPPHLVDQWVRELTDRFHLHAIAVTSSSAGRLERGLPVNETIFGVYPFTVVSLDYIKSERRRHDFVRACPELVIVDEAHTCTNAGAGRHLRYELLRSLAEDAERHMLLLTATPHSGDETAFYNLLGLVDPEYEQLADATGPERERLRTRLARHFVQRRRPDLDEWMDSRLFPQRERAELTYRLTGEWDDLFEKVLAYCADVTREASGDERRQRLTFWGTLALMRCVSSSPAAAAQALRTRMIRGEEDTEELADRLFDGGADDLPDDDVEPAADTGDPRLHALVKQAERLAGREGDPKLARLLDHVEALLEKDFSPVIFCRYIATAHYVGEHLRKRFTEARLAVVTGEYPPEERQRRVEELGEAETRRILVATDCLSEGINLQHYLDAVIHYDLSWNPTRHEQREGRVDRYGQVKPIVRATLIYGSNNPVDGAVLQVIIRKAESIRRELGVPVPLPDDDHSLTNALMHAVLLRGGLTEQRDLFDATELEEAQTLEVEWTRLAESAKRNRTVFAQRRLRPEEVLPEWKQMQAILGNRDDVERFVSRALARLGAGPTMVGRGARAPLAALPEVLRERLASDGMEGTVRISFAYPPPSGFTFIHRSHPLVAALADDLLERALAGDDANSGLSRLGRTGAWRSRAVREPTTIVLLRLRHQLKYQKANQSSTLLVEEALPVAFVGRDRSRIEIGPEVSSWLDGEVGDDLTEHARKRLVAEALEHLEKSRRKLEDLAASQADKLLADHRRVREASDARGRYEVRSLRPVDVIAAFHLVPA